jgi:hypothetical protein
MLSNRWSNVVVGSLKASRVVLGLALVMAACSGPALAFGDEVPEIDPGSMASALTALVGGMLVLTDRLRRK